MVSRLHLPAQTAGLHLSWQGARRNADPQADRRRGGRSGGQSEGAQRPSPRMAKGPVAKGPTRGGGKTRAPSRVGRLVLLLIGFVLVAVGVILRRSYGVSQAKAISELQQKREALVSEQLKLQD